VSDRRNRVRRATSDGTSGCYQHVDNHHLDNHVHDHHLDDLDDNYDDATVGTGTSYDDPRFDEHDDVSTDADYDAAHYDNTTAPQTLTCARDAAVASPISRQQSATIYGPR
jgi:hypothetical protein